MTRLPKSVVSFGALVLTAGALTLAVPRAAHAVAAALVQVSNPPASPANTEDTSRQANQLVQLHCQTAGDGDISGCSLVSSGAFFTVPAPQSFVITTVDVRSLLDFTGSNAVFLTGSVAGITNHAWAFSGGNTFEYQYPSGIVYPSGAVFITTVHSAEVYITGYLTAN